MGVNVGWSNPQRYPLTTLGLADVSDASPRQSRLACGERAPARTKGEIQTSGLSM